MGDLQRKRVRRYRDRAKRFRASAAKTKKRTDRPALIQLAQLCDILADGIEVQLRASLVLVAPTRRTARTRDLTDLLQGEEPTDE